MSYARPLTQLLDDQDLSILGDRGTADGQVFGASCARLLVQAVRHGWEETLLEICDQAEAGGCLKEVLRGAILGGAPLLVHAAMCGQTVMAANVSIRCIEYCA
jgi:hypothetical protein